MQHWLVCSALLLTLSCAPESWRAMGKRADGVRRERMQASPQWHDGHFENPQPMTNDLLLALKDTLDASPNVTPTTPVPVVAVDPQAFATPSASGLRVTWLGHSTTLVEIDGVRILTDPVWSERVSPLRFIGPQRWFEPLIALKDMPEVDAVLISHDHYDHLDHQTIVAMKDWRTTFIVPLGIGADLAYWGVPEDRIVELDWWESTHVGELEIHALPARHASGRYVLDDAGNLWAGFALVGSRHRVYFSGDTGLFPGLTEIGQRFGPFDLTMIEAGQYGRSWPDWHLGPEQAVRAHQMVQGRLMLPVHWATFALAFHGWTEPLERLLVAARQTQTAVVAPKPGQAFEPASPPAVERWWPDLPFNTAEQDPIAASLMGTAP